MLTFRTGLNAIVCRWSYVQSMKETRSRVALVADMDRLWAIGGYDGMKNLSTVCKARAGNASFSSKGKQHKLLSYKEKGCVMSRKRG